MKRSGNGCLRASDRARVGNAYTSADMTSSRLTPARCVKSWNNPLISLAWLYHFERIVCMPVLSTSNGCVTLHVLAREGTRSNSGCKQMATAP